MSHNNAAVNNSNDKETPEFRNVRAQLRLSERNWIVVDKKVSLDVGEFSDLHPDTAEVFFAGGEKTGNVNLGISNIYIEAKKKPHYKCPNCGCFCKAHEYVTRNYIHVPDLGFRCILTVKLPKLDCGSCGKKPRLRFPAARRNVSFTKEMEKAVLTEVSDLNLSKTAEKLGLSRRIVAGILEYNVKRAIPEQDLSDMTQVFIDEIQFGSGHNYVTVFSNARKKVVFMTSGKGKETIQEFVEYLKIQGGDPDNIRVASADMSRAFEGGIMDFLPNARLVWDRFHLVQAMNNDLNKIRQRTMRNYKGKLKHAKYTVLRRAGNMDEKNVERLGEIRLNNPTLALAFDMKEAFCEILTNTDMYEAQDDFEEWFWWVENQGCEEMKERCRKFKKKIDRILAWFDHKVSNGVAEGINAMIKKTNAEAFGYWNLTNFISMCLFRHGELVLRV